MGLTMQYVCKLKTSFFSETINSIRRIPPVVLWNDSVWPLWSRQRVWIIIITCFETWRWSRKLFSFLSSLSEEISVKSNETLQNLGLGALKAKIIVLLNTDPLRIQGHKCHSGWASCLYSWCLHGHWTPGHLRMCNGVQAMGCRN